METADFDVADFNERYAGDRSVYVRFYTFPERDEEASAKAGRTICKDAEYVEIRAPGNQNNIVNRKVTKMDIERFRERYESFRAGMAEQTIGTPLSEVPWITRSQVEELAYMRVRTLETLAGVSDTTCQSHAGLLDLRNRAKAMLEAADKMAPITALEAENKELKNQLGAMSEQMKELTAALKSIQSGAKQAKE